MKAVRAETPKETRYHLAPRMSRIRVSAVREILKVAEQPEVISFAGGLPAPELFPVEPIAGALASVLAHQGPSALQYSTTEGWAPLREWIAQHLRTRAIDASAERVLITSGSQQGIDLVSKAFLDRGDGVVVENPCYLAALQTFSGFEASLIAVGSDDQGMRVDQVERAVNEKRPKLIYVVSNFHNPKGTTLSLERRKQLIEISRRSGVPIVEDDPYGELRYAGETVPSIASMDTDGSVIYLSTFSKTLSPGLRIGWVLASEAIIRAITVAKQASDLHTSTLVQRAVAQMLDSFDYAGHLRRIQTAYGERRQAMLASLTAHFPEGVRWTRPDGGLFLWVELPRAMQAEDLLEDAVRARVAFVPGAPFFARNPQHQFLRLNFSHCPPAMIDEGIRRLARAVESKMGLAAVPT